MAKFCTKCGASMDDDKRFCTECGTPVQAAAPQQAPPQYQNTRQAAPPPVYQQPQAPYGEVPPSSNSKYQPISTGGYIGIMILMAIPLLGLLLTIIWALGGCRKVNKRNLARASLIMIIIGLIIGAVLFFAGKSLVNTVLESIGYEDQVSSGDTDSDEDDVLGVLAGLLGGDTNNGSSGSSDLDALSGLLNGILGGDTSNNGDNNGGNLIDNINDINEQAEKQNSGWPSSLRKYPGGKATAVASYRTEITDTTLEDMLAWIDDLKSDGFAYQDFYDFGMTEEDMLSVNGWWATDGTIYLSISFDGSKVIIDHMNELPDMSSILG